MKPRSDGARILALVACAQFVIVLDSSVMNMALPSISRELSTSEAALSWVTNAYVLTFGGFLLVGAGWPTTPARAGSSRAACSCSARPRCPARWPAAAAG